MKVIIPKEQISIVFEQGVRFDQYYHLPLWFMDMGDGKFEVLSFKDLPNEIQKRIKELL